MLQSGFKASRTGDIRRLAQFCWTNNSRYWIKRERYIKGQPQVIIITGNRKKIDLAAIEKLYGPVVEHKFKDIYKD